MKARLFWAALSWAALFWLCSLLPLPLAAQTDSGSYQGPGILGGFLGNIGDRSGQEVDLRFWAGVNGIYSTNLQPLITDAHGNLIHAPNLFGMSANAGAYGTHHWTHAQLSLSYTGNYNYYPNYTAYDGTNQALTLGLSAQYSSRVAFDLRVSGATLNQGTGAVAQAAAAGGSFNGTQVFDSRASYVDVNGSMTLIQSPRTSYTLGAGANGYYYQSNELTSASGYRATASANHRVSLSNSFGAVYTYSTQLATGYNAHFQTFAGQYLGDFGRFWKLTITAGASTSQISQTLALLFPVIGANGSVTLQSFPSQVAFRNFYPTGSGQLTRQFERASAHVSYSRSVGASNGLSVSGLTETATGGISYTGIHKWNFGIDGRYTRLESLGQPPGTWTWYGGGTGATYEVARYTHLTARFDLGHYDLGTGYVRTVKQATFGIAFAPGIIPLSLW